MQKSQFKEAQHAYFSKFLSHRVYINPIYPHGMVVQTTDSTSSLHGNKLLPNSTQIFLQI